MDQQPPGGGPREPTSEPQSEQAPTDPWAAPPGQPAMPGQQGRQADYPSEPYSSQQPYGPPYGPPYAPPYPGYPYPPYAVMPSPPANGMSIAALVVGIIGIVMPFAVPAIVALVLGYVSKGHIDRSGGMQGGRGFAIAGIVLGWIGVALGLVVIGIYAWFFTYAFNNPEFFDYYRTLQTPRLP